MPLSGPILQRVRLWALCIYGHVLHVVFTFYKASSLGSVIATERRCAHSVNGLYFNFKQLLLPVVDVFADSHLLGLSFAFYVVWNSETKNFLCWNPLKIRLVVLTMPSWMCWFQMHCLAISNERSLAVSICLKFLDLWELICANASVKSYRPCPTSLLRPTNVHWKNWFWNRLSSFVVFSSPKHPWLLEAKHEI